MAFTYDLIIVPGIGGSSLSYRGGFGGKTKLWYNPTALAINSPLSFALDVDGKSPYPLVGKTLFADGPVDMGVYEPLLTFLSNHGKTPKFFAYDWRLNLPDTAAAFVAFLQSIPLAEEFDVVAHSMGGLVCQHAYPLWLAAGNSPKWDITAYLNAPHGGSHWANLCLNGVWFDGAWMRPLGQIFDFAIKVNSLTFSGYTSVAGQMGIAAGSWPALYQLLPCLIGQYAGLDPIGGTAYLPASYGSGPGGIQQQWLTKALAEWQVLINLATQPRPTEFSLIGTDRNTPQSFTRAALQATLSDCNFSFDGDGTVSDARLRRNGCAAIEFSNTGHDDITTTGPVLGELLQRLAIPPTTDTEESNLVLVGNAPPVPPPPTFHPITPLSTWANQFANTKGDP